MAFLRPLEKVVSAKEVKSAPPKVWAKMSEDVPMETCSCGRAFWIATMAWIGWLLVTVN
jgi:hypothetical protein